MRKVNKAKRSRKKAIEPNVIKSAPFLNIKTHGALRRARRVFSSHITGKEFACRLHKLASDNHSFCNTEAGLLGFFHLLRRQTANTAEA